ncbi:hypothetical protein AF72_12475 [Xylella taiwanensis]|uniref:Uncharacterized protein n=1 Tax=Xylella taiwanensis TaxID=1444770 RepID=Z9JGJ8_9GAMM|nr:hypothetical protein [Xylella taiwanensis]AXI84416.1 hypothetical protein AB672_11000 [Xylella taiwanensis]EWS77128.1 hypothetical protein AF72_12475 [Xylella taiwanensis]MCD8457712.1 hypothetical protein [Xylella taiwanensis]
MFGIFASKPQKDSPLAADDAPGDAVILKIQHHQSGLVSLDNHALLPRRFQARRNHDAPRSTPGSVLSAVSLVSCEDLPFCKMCPCHDAPQPSASLRPMQQAISWCGVM